MIELLPMVKSLAQMGVTPTAIIALTIALKINKTFSAFDKRLANLESKLDTK